MNAEDVIECRVLTGFHCLPFAQYTTPHTNRRCEHEAGMTMIGASIGGRPVGLAVFSCQNDSEKASLESIFVHPDARRRGVGRGLLQAVDSTLIERGVAGVTGRGTTTLDRPRWWSACWLILGGPIQCRHPRCIVAVVGFSITSSGTAG